jgi:cytidylate kinase
MSTELPVTDHRIGLLRHSWKNRPVWDWTREPQHAPELPFTVAISREAGAPGLEIAQLIGEQLGWPVYDREILELIAKESGLRGELYESVDERDQSWLIEALSGLSQQKTVSTSGFVHHLAKVMRALAARGHCVIVGRGATACLPRQSTLRLRIVAEMGDRVRRIAREWAVGEDEAHAIVQRIERERSQFVKRHFHRDVLDVHNFDLVVNASRLSPALCAAAAVQALHEMQEAPQQATPAGKSSSIR